MIALSVPADGVPRKTSESRMRPWEQIVGQLKLAPLYDLPDTICILEKGWWILSAYDLSCGECDFEPNTLYLNHVPSLEGQLGVPLQSLTAVLSHICWAWIAKEPHRVGGLRSSLGVTEGHLSQKLTLSAVGNGDFYRLAFVPKLVQAACSGHR